MTAAVTNEPGELQVTRRRPNAVENRAGNQDRATLSPSRRTSVAGLLPARIAPKNSDVDQTAALNSDLVRRGTVVIGKRIKWRRFKEPPPPLVPPDIEMFGALDFGPSDRLSLGAWLSEEDWPRDKMSIVTLEGYLVAMIVWPVNVSPGAWLPAIWGIRGWKVAAKIEAPASFDKFLRLIVGYRQQLSNVLNAGALSFLPALHDSVVGSASPNAATCWSQGFMLALQQGSQSLNWRSAEFISAIKLIAVHASSVAPFSSKSESALAAELGTAVRTIVGERSLGIRKSSRFAAAALPI